MQNNKDAFKFIGKERRVYDQPIEGKPISYFQDAMIRFRKNKANVTAAIILGLLILLSIFIPITTSKNYTVIEEQLTYLPPRIPILEKFGIFNGNRQVQLEPVNLDQIDPITELGLPNDYDIKYVVPGTLRNYYAPSTDTGPTSLGGEVIFRMGGTAEHYTLSTQNTYLFRNDTEVTIDIASFENAEDATFRLYIILRNQPHIIGELVEAGEHTFTVEGILGSGRVNSELFIDIQSENKNAGIVVSSISAVFEEETIFDFEAYNLFSSFVIVPDTGGAGQKLRINNMTLYAVFEYRT